jgi:hypothetical protein
MQGAQEGEKVVAEGIGLLELEKVKDYLDEDQDNDDPLQAGSPASVAQAGKHLGDVHEGFRFVADLIIPLAQLEEVGHGQVETVRFLVFPSDFRLVQHHDIGDLWRGKGSVIAV